MRGSGCTFEFPITTYKDTWGFQFRYICMHALLGIGMCTVALQSESISDQKFSLVTARRYRMQADGQEDVATAPSAFTPAVHSDFFGAPHFYTYASYICVH